MGDAAPSTAPVDPRLLALLGTLREAPPADQGAGCAERAPLPGGPTIEGSARRVAPGVGGGDVYLVAVERWMRANAAAKAQQPAACLVTVGGLAAQFDLTRQCFPVDQIAAGGAMVSSEITPPVADALSRAGLPERWRAGSVVSLVVPDRVATVELRYADGSVASERVINNVVLAHVARDAAAALPERVAWYDAGGRPIQPGRVFDLARAEQELATAPAPLAGLYARANTLIDGGADAFSRQLDALKGTPVVVHHWASWCSPCRVEVPVFQQATVTHGHAIAFVGVNARDHAASARAFLAQLPLPFPSYADPSGEIARGQRLESYVPVTQFIGPDGTTVHVRAGAYSSLEQLSTDIERYLR